MRIKCNHKSKLNAEKWRMKFQISWAMSNQVAMRVHADEMNRRRKKSDSQ